MKTGFLVAFLTVTVTHSNALAMEESVVEKVGVAEYNPQNPPLRQFKDGTLSVDSVKTTEGVGIIVNHFGKKPYVVDLSGEEFYGIEQISEIRRLAKDRLYVAGMINWAASAVVILDATTGKKLDLFWAYHPSLSPSGRYVAFSRFYPQHGNMATVTDCYMLYDTTKSQAENRPLIKENPSVGSPDSLVEVGFKVFPLEPSESANTCYSKQQAQNPNATGHNQQSPFFWSANSKSVAFVDQVYPNLTLVQVEIATDGMSNTVSTHNLNAGKDPCGNACKKWSYESLSISDGDVTFKVKDSTGGIKSVFIQKANFVQQNWKQK